MGGPKMDAPKMDGPKMGGPKMDMAGKGAAAKPKPDAARMQAQMGFMKARRLGEDAAKLRAAGAAAERTTLQALRTRFDRLDRSLRAIKTSDASTKTLLQKARRQLDAADKALIDTRLSLDLEKSKQRAKKKPAPAEDF